MPIAALLTDAEARGRLAAAVHGWEKAWFCQRAAELVEYVGRDRPTIVFVEPWDADGTSTAPTVARLHRNRPLTPVVVCCRLQADAVREVLRLGQAGACDFVLLGYDDLGACLRRILARAGGGRGANRDGARRAGAVPAGGGVAGRRLLFAARA